MNEIADSFGGLNIGRGCRTCNHASFLFKDLNLDMHAVEGLNPDLVILYLQVVVVVVVFLIIIVLDGNDGLVVHNSEATYLSRDQSPGKLGNSA